MARRLGEILVSEGACTPEDVRNALKNQVIFGGRLGTNLLEIKAVTEDALARALGKQHGLPWLCGDFAVDPSATALLTPEIADRCEAIPYLVVDRRRLVVLVADPKNLAKLDEVAFATGKSVHTIVVPEARAWALLRSTYGIDRHLRGIEVDFGTLKKPAAPAEAAPAPAGDGGPDLIGEDEFEEIYAGTGAPPAGPTDEVVEVTDLVEPPEPAPPPPALAPPPLPAAPQSPPPQPASVAEVLAALSSGAGHEPPSHPVAPAPRAEEPEPTPLGFEEALRSLDGVKERDAIARTVLRYARSRFHRAVVLTIQRGTALGWAGLGEKLDPAVVRRIRLDLASPGILQTTVRTRAHFLGPIPRTEANIRLLKALGGGVPGNALLVPILALGRVVNVIYADAGRGAMLDASGVGELLILATRIAKSYESLVERV